ncbi:MAG: hypothetical protein A2W76_08265 [Gammaproteobacteria bacterium RIFCSPLOWO2_12_47_11]|nr:MAG: hypothetical protein A2W76_08265 [Gammaproteobacteria bacterium RIFCSPLOWO2_12_47_11]
MTDFRYHDYLISLIFGNSDIINTQDCNFNIAKNIVIYLNLPVRPVKFCKCYFYPGPYTWNRKTGIRYLGIYQHNYPGNNFREIFGAVNRLTILYIIYVGSF